MAANGNFQRGPCALPAPSIAPETVPALPGPGSRARSTKPLANGRWFATCPAFAGGRSQARPEQVAGSHGIPVTGGWEVAGQLGAGRVVESDVGGGEVPGEVGAGAGARDEQDVRGEVE